MAEGKGGVAMYVRLQIAYALEFAIWGCWSYSLGSYGKEHSIAVGALYAAFALGALFAPVVGPIADKKFAAQKVFAFMQLICGVALGACYVIAQKAAEAGASDPGALWWALMFIAGLMFMPSIPLLNAIVFKHIPNDKKSPFVFIFGTLGWIAVNLLLGYMGMEKGQAGLEKFYLVDAICAWALAVYALTLPNTPPAGSSNGDPFGFKALGLFKRPDFAIFIICTTLVGIFGSNFYFPLFGQYFYGAKGVFNQYSEIIFMAALAFAVAKIGLKWTLTLGLAAWGVRYLLFAQGTDGCALVGIFCHGLAYAFLYTAAYMYGDKVAPKEMKASVQALIAFLLLGVAQTLSGYAADGIMKKYENKTAAPAAATETENASFMLTVPAYAQDQDINAAVEAASDAAEATVDAVADAADAATDAVADAADAATDAVADAAEAATDAVADAAEAATDAVADAAEAASDTVAEAAQEKIPFWKCIDQKNVAGHDWKKIWGLPGIFCLIFAVIFAILGREPQSPEEVEEKAEA